MARTRRRHRKRVWRVAGERAVAMRELADALWSVLRVWGLILVMWGKWSFVAHGGYVLV